MINKIFIDLDETLVHTCLSDLEQEHLVISLPNDYDYYTIVRPSAINVIKFARDMVGRNNVYILTVATRKYAEQICEKAGFEFDNDHIFTREDINRNEFRGAYGGQHCYSNEDVAHKDNVLIDNLPPHYNTSKTSYIGIDSDNYLNVDDYYGVNYKEEKFYNDVCEFLLLKNK